MSETVNELCFDRPDVNELVDWALQSNDLNLPDHLQTTTKAELFLCLANFRKFSLAIFTITINIVNNVRILHEA